MLRRRRWRARSLPRTAWSRYPARCRVLCGGWRDRLLASARFDLTPCKRSRLFYRADEGQDGENRERADGDACLVRPGAPHFALALAAWRDAGAVSSLALGDHAAADDGEGGAAALRLLPAPLA